MSHEALFAASVRFWDEIELLPVTGSGASGVRAYTDELAGRYANGRVMSCWFDVFAAKRAGDFDPQRLFAYLVKSRLFKQEPIRNAFNGYEIPAGRDPELGLTDLHPFDLPGYLGRLLQDGGAYSKSRKSMAYYDLGLSAALELSAGDLNGIEILVSTTAWCPFFFDVSWDQTLVVYRPADHRLYVMMATDTD